MKQLALVVSVTVAFLGWFYWPELRRAQKKAATYRKAAAHFYLVQLEQAALLKQIAKTVEKIRNTQLDPV